MNDDTAYEMAHLEIKNKSTVPGLWAKAIAFSDGDERRAEANYIRYRAAELINQYKLASALAKEIPPSLPSEPTITGARQSPANLAPEPASAVEKQQSEVDLKFLWGAIAIVIQIILFSIFFVTFNFDLPGMLGAAAGSLISPESLILIPIGIVYVKSPGRLLIFMLAVFAIRLGIFQAVDGYWSSRTMAFLAIAALVVYLPIDIALLIRGSSIKKTPSEDTQISANNPLQGNPRDAERPWDAERP